MRQALQAQQKRMESLGVVAISADVGAEDAGSGGTALDMGDGRTGARARNSGQPKTPTRANVFVLAVSLSICCLETCC